jgi:hypothetical protein
VVHHRQQGRATGHATTPIPRAKPHLGVPGFEGFQDGPVMSDRVLLDIGDLRGLGPPGFQDAVQRFEEYSHEDVAGGAQDDIVEAQVCLDEGAHIVGIVGFLHGGQMNLQLVDFLGGDP